MVSFGHFEPQSYQNRHLNDTTSQNIAGVQCGKAVHILLVPRMRVNQSFKQKINLKFFVRFVCVNYKKVLALMLWKGTLGYVSS